MAKNKTPDSVPTLDFTKFSDANEAMEAMRTMMASFAVTYGSEIAAQAIPATLAKESVSLHSAHEKMEIEALTLRNKEIDAEIERLTAPLREEKNNNIIRLSSLNVRVAGDRKPRTTVACPECGQGRHAENDKTATCGTYARYSAVRDGAKAARTPVPSFSEYLLKTNQISPAQV